jgi:sphingomyelin phosphodiesterase 2
MLARGLLWVSKHREARLNAIGDFLSANSRASSNASATSDTPLDVSGDASQYDVVCLQEVWVKADGEMLKRKARESGLIHARRFHS